jgi:hypothetical protein
MKRSLPLILAAALIACKKEAPTPPAASPVAPQPEMVPVYTCPRDTTSFRILVNGIEKTIRESQEPGCHMALPYDLWPFNIPEGVTVFDWAGSVSKGSEIMLISHGWHNLRVDGVTIGWANGDTLVYVVPE